MIDLKFRRIEDERGATMIEAMFVLPILIGTVFFIVWYSGTMHEGNMMNEALYRAGKIASTVPNLDISLVSADTADTQAIKEFRRAWKANDMSRKAGIDFLTSVGFFKNPADKKLLPLTKKVQRVSPDGTPHPGLANTRTVVGEIMPLLPGECAEYQTDPSKPSTKKTTCNNKVIDASYSDDKPLSEQTSQPLQAPKSLLKYYPIKMIAMANRKGSMFHGGKGISEYNFFVVREPIPAGPFSQAIETELGNGNVGDGVPPDPLKYGAGADEVPAVAACPAFPSPVVALVKQSLGTAMSLSSSCPPFNSNGQKIIGTGGGPAIFADSISCFKKCKEL